MPLIDSSHAVIRSSELEICFHTKGAELCSVKNNAGFEYIWQADPKIWPRHAPVLFPIVGKLKDNTFLYENKPFELPQHGFARDLEFELIEQNESCCTFQLVSSVETDMRYPFDFVLRITYEVTAQTLKTSYTIRNLFNRDMHVSIGAHPGFNCFANSKFEDHYLEFKTSGLLQTRLHEGLLTNIHSPVSLKDQTLPLSTSLFDNDALVFENNQINSVTLKSKKSPNSVEMKCTDWPYFGIWTKKGCDQFVCLEPWYGIADEMDSTQELINKKGILHLPAGEYFNCSFDISFK